MGSNEDIQKFAQELVASRMAVNPATEEPTEQAEEASVEEQEVDESQSEQEADNQPDYIELKAVGETHKLTLDQIKELASKGLDYTKKTQEIPERVRAEVERTVQERTKAVEAERNRLHEASDLVESLINKPFVTADQLDQLLQDGDTETYLRLSRQEERRLEILNQAKAERQKMLADKARAEQEQLNQAANYHTQNLLQTMPELKDAAAQAKLEAYLRGMNLTDDLMLRFIANGGLTVAEKARRYDELSGGKLEPVRKDPPKVIKKVGATVNKQTYTQKDLEDNSNRLKQTGNIRDAASLYLKMQQGLKK